jgi:hypothetical protein
MISLSKLHRCGIVVTIALVLVIAMAAPAQRVNYTWMEMPRKEADKLLENSPWSQTQVDTDVSEQFYSPTRPGTSSVGQSTSKGVSSSSQQSINNSRADRGAVNEEVYVKYRISFLSARPVRQALAKVILSSEKGPNEQLATQLQAFVERDFSPFVVVAVTVKSNDQRWSGPVMQAISSASTDSLKNNAYLERPDGKRLFLTQYIPPISDGLGAKFIFPRLVDGEPFLKQGSGNVRFFAQFNDSFKLNMMYKISDMIFDQRLEY